MIKSGKFQHMLGEQIIEYKLSYYDRLSESVLEDILLACEYAGKLQFKDKSIVVMMPCLDQVMDQ